MCLLHHRMLSEWNFSDVTNNEILGSNAAKKIQSFRLRAGDHAIIGCLNSNKILNPVVCKCYFRISTLERLQLESVRNWTELTFSPFGWKQKHSIRVLNTFGGLNHWRGDSVFKLIVDGWWISRQTHSMYSILFALSKCGNALNT